MLLLLFINDFYGVFLAVTSMRIFLPEWKNVCTEIYIIYLNQVCEQWKHEVPIQVDAFVRNDILVMEC